MNEPFTAAAKVRRSYIYYKSSSPTGASSLSTDSIVPVCNMLQRNHHYFFPGRHESLIGQTCFSGRTSTRKICLHCENASRSASCTFISLHSTGRNSITHKCLCAKPPQDATFLPLNKMETNWSELREFIPGYKVRP